MSAPSAIKAWAQAVKDARATLPRKDFLKVIASGPCDRSDVQAARRLLCKPRYANQEAAE